MSARPQLSLGGERRRRRLWPARPCATASGAAIPLRPQAFAVLRCLAERPGRLVSKDELMAAVWPGIAVTDDSLVQAVGDIRRAIGDEAHAVVRTVPRRGYRLVPAARRGRPLPEAARGGWGGAVGAAGAWWRGGPRAPGGSRRLGAAGRRRRWSVVLPFDALARRTPVARLLASTSDRGRRSPTSARIPEFTGLAGALPELRGRGRRSGEVARTIRGGTSWSAGSIDREGDRVRVTAQLVDARTGGILWSERWDRPPRTSSPWRPRSPSRSPTGWRRRRPDRGDRAQRRSPQTPRQA